MAECSAQLVVSTNQFVMIGDITQELQHFASTILSLQFPTRGVQLISRVIKDANLLRHRENDEPLIKF